MGEYYSTAADAQYLTIRKRTYNAAPSIGMYDVTGQDFNLLQDRFFQFRFRYVYDNYQIGDCTPISDISVPNASLTKNNGVHVTVNTGHKTVKKIEVMMREGNGSDDTGNTNPEWYIFSTVDKVKLALSDNVPYVVDFTGQQPLSSVSRIDTDINFQAVPIAADHIEVVSTNQIVAGAITEGYDNVNIAATLTAAYDDNGYRLYSSLNTTITILTVTLPSAGDIMVFVLEALVGGAVTKHTLTLTGPNVATALSLATAVASAMTSYGAAGVAATPTAGGYDVSNATFSTTVSSYRPSLINTRTFMIKPYLYDVGIVYYDSEMRNGGVNPLGTVQWDLKFPVDSGTLLPIATLPYISLTITSVAPAWAAYYQVVLRPKKIEHVFTGKIIYTSGTEGTVDPAVEWTWKKGDRYRVIGGAFSSTTNSDFELVSYDESSGDFVASAGVAPDLYAMFYRLDTTPVSSPFYFEFIGLGTLPITTRFHSGNVQNQTVSLPAILKITAGDAYAKLPTIVYSAGIDYPDGLYGELRITDKVSTELWGKGRVQIETPTQRQQKYGQLRRWSGKLFPNTQVNNLSTWDAGNYNNDLNARFGVITGLREIGYVLVNIQWANKSSTLLNRIQVSNPDGSTQLLVTDRLLGTTNPSENEYGTKHPGSICVDGNHLYFVDTLKGKAIRAATNGEFPISEYFNNKYWRDKSTLIESSSNYEVISGYDKKFNDLYITIRNLALSPDFQETIYFHESTVEAEQAWKYNIDMKDASGNVIQWYGWVGQSFFTFMQGSVWQQGALVDGDNEPVYLKLFGHNKSLIVETIGMIEYDKVKVFLTHEIHSNIAPTLVEFFIPPNTMYPNGMYSYLKPGNYSYKEGVFYAAIKRDWFTKGIPADDTAGRWQIANGRQLRGHVVRVRLHYTTNDYTVLFSTGVGMIASDRS